MERLADFFAHLHPAIVHLPIGMLVLAIIFDLLTHVKGMRKLRVAVRPALLLGNIGALLAVASGWLLSGRGGYEESLVTQHQNLGISTLIFGWLLYFFRHHTLRMDPDKAKRKQVRSLLFLPLLILLILTGHKGGVLTHGDDYFKRADTTATVVSTAVLENPDVAIFYADVIQPLLDKKCISCHGPSKQKGQLRLDQASFIRKGGKHGNLLDVTLDSALLWVRINLPEEDEKHMPPRQKAQLTSAEMELLRWWLKGSADFEKKIGDYAAAESIRKALGAQASSTTNWVPEAPVSAADAELLRKLQRAGVLVLPVATGNNYLQASFVNVPTPTSETWQLIRQLAPQLVSLDLARTTLRDEDLAQLGDCKVLYELSLRATNVTASGLEKLAALSSLQKLNISQTTVGDDAVPTLLKLQGLHELFAFGSRLSHSGYRQLATKADLQLDTGKYMLPHLATDTTVFRRKR